MARTRSRSIPLTAARAPLLLRPDQLVEVRLLLDQAVLLAQLGELLDRRPVEVRPPRGQLDRLGGLGWDLRVLEEDLAHLVRVVLRVVERLVDRGHEAVDDLRVLLRILLRREVGGYREVRRGVDVERIDPLGLAGLALADERLHHARAVDPPGLERR